MRLTYLATAARVSADDVLADLKAKGWKAYKQGQKMWDSMKSPRDIVEVLAKRYNGIIMMAVVTDSTFSVTLSVLVSFTQTGKIEREVLKENKGNLNTFFSLRSWGPSNLAEVEKTAKEQSALVKRLLGPRKPKDRSGVQYKGKNGPEALNLWLTDAEEAISEILQVAKRIGRGDFWRESVSSSSIARDVYSNRLSEPWGIPYREASKKIIAILRKLAKQGKVEEIGPRDSGQTQTLWRWKGPA